MWKALLEQLVSWLLPILEQEAQQRILSWLNNQSKAAIVEKSMGVPRSDKWPTVRKHHLAKEPVCQWCGGKDHLEVHHVQPFHVSPEDELQDPNLITFCEAPGKECHFKIGHNGTSWKDFNPNVRKDCQAHKTQV